MTRRTALKVIGASGAAAGAATQLGGVLANQRPVRAALAAGTGATPDLASPTPTLQVFVSRRDDLFDLRFDCYNLVLDPTGTKLVRTSPRAMAHLVVVFPTQSLGEQAVFQSSAPPPPPWPDPPLGAYAAGPSQLVFTVPSIVASIPFTMDGLLNWSQLVPAISPAGLGTPTAVPAAPTQLQTSIEAPWQLLLSPDGKGRWHHTSQPVTHDGWTELWQTRLGTGVAEPPVVQPYVRAIWTPGYPLAGSNPFPTMSLAPQDRVDLVTLSSGGVASQTGLPVKGVPVPANLFMLTPLGATLDVDGRWNEPSVSSIIEWRHRMTTGRDSYVRIVRQGFLYPFGHKALHITITDREFQVSPAGDVVAYLVQRQYVEIVQPTKTYHGTPEPNRGRQNPLRTITVKTAVSPPIDLPAIIAGSNNVGGGAFWVMAAGSPVPFAFQGIDLEGRKVDFTTAAIWVDEQTAFDTVDGSVAAIAAEYANPGNLARRNPNTHGNLVAFAPPSPTEPGATAHHADAIEFGAAPIPNPLAHEPAWYPLIASATVRVPAAEQATGAELPGSPPVMEYAPAYLLHGFRVGYPEIFMFLQATSTAPPLVFPADKSGGMATPNFAIDGLSRQHGPTSDSKNLLDNRKFDPTTYFAGLEAKILGGLDLFKIIEALVGAAAGNNVPKIKAHLVFPSNHSNLAPTGLLTTIDWSPQVAEDPIGFFDPKGTATKTLHLKVKIFVPFADPQNTTFQIQGNLVNFDVNLFGKDDKGGLTFLNIHFNKMHLSAKTGAKTHFDVDIDSVTFEGPLSFIEELETYLASLGGPSIDIEPSGLTVSYSLPLPSIGVGVFAIENISIGGALTLPFSGGPVRLKINFCTRDNPFLLSISLFGGGGFFGIALGTDGIELIEVSLEFGADISLDLGVASGGVSIMAGIYFSLANNDHPTGAHPPAEVVTLTGFLQASGNLEVLGIISISIVFYLGFTYQNPGKCTGTCTVTVTVKVLIFSASVSMTVTKSFGGGGDPTFAQAISASDFATYCAAFA